MQIDRQFYGGVRNYAASVLTSCILHVAGSSIEHTYKVSPLAISTQPVHQCQKYSHMHCREVSHENTLYSSSRGVGKDKFTRVGEGDMLLSAYM